MNNSDLCMCKYSVTDLIKSVKATHKLIELLTFDDNHETIAKMLQIQEDNCKVVLEEIDRVFADDHYHSHRKMLKYIVKLVRQQILSQKDDHDRVVPYRLNNKAIWELINIIFHSP